MNRIKYLLLITFLFVIFPSCILASGGIYVGSSNMSIPIGGNGSIPITASNAVGRIDLSSSNPSVVTLSTSSFWIDNTTSYVDVYSKGIGSATITVKLYDAATMDEEDLSGQTYYVYVNVYQPSTPPTPQQPQTQPKTEDKRSSNARLGSLVIDGYNPVKVDDNNYTLTVPNNVSSLEIKATSEDSKASVSGTGKKDLNIGDNNYDIVITAENGATNTIHVKITRKNGYYYDDLNTLLKDDSIKNADIIINNTQVLTKNDLKNIKASGKVFNFNYLDNNNKLIYSFIIDGSSIDNEADLNTAIAFKSGNIDEVNKLSNYVNGLNLLFTQNGGIPSGVKLKIYVGNRYNDNTVLNIYNYENKNLNTFADNIVVKDGYITFDLTNTSEKLVTQATITISEKSPIDIAIILIVIMIIEFLVIIGMIVYYFVKIKPDLKANAFIYGDGEL